MITALEILFIGMGTVMGLWIAWKMAVDYFVPRKRRELAHAQPIDTPATPVVDAVQPTAPAGTVSSQPAAAEQDPVRAAAAAAGVKSVLAGVPERKPLWKRL